MKKLLLTLLLFSAGTGISAAKTYDLKSPDGKIAVRVDVGADAVSYSISRDGKELIAPSPLSLTLADGRVLGRKASVRKASAKSVDEIIEAPFYKRSAVEDRYNSLTLTFKGDYGIDFRAYDDGAAYRFRTSMKDEITVTDELVDIRFPEDFTTLVPYARDGKKESGLARYYFNSFESTYSTQPVSKVADNRQAFLADPGRRRNGENRHHRGRPGRLSGACTSTTPRAGKALRGNFAPYPAKEVQGGHNELQLLVTEREDFIARTSGTRTFPWRVFAIAGRDIQLADNDMVYRLAAPSRVEDVSWIKPGKVAWDWWNTWNLYGVDFKSGINNETYKYYIDFAADHGIEYVILDEGWAVNKKADLFQVVPEIDLPELVAYGKERGVGIVLWAGFYATERDLERVCKHYSEMGIKGFKVDFLDRDDQKIADFTYRLAETAAKYRLFLDMHGYHKPAGIQRTYPNVLNFEGVFGLEQMKWTSEKTDMVTYDVTIPFIRMLAGPMDYTQGAMRNATRRNFRAVGSEAMSQGTRCRQLAEYVIFESPFNMLCDSPSNYMREPECTESFASVPTTWDETVGLDGRVGEYVSIARRKGDTWYVGGMTDWNARTLTIDLGFLGEGALHRRTVPRRRQRRQGGPRLQTRVGRNSRRPEADGEDGSRRRLRPEGLAQIARGDTHEKPGRPIEAARVSFREAGCPASLLREDRRIAVALGEDFTRQAAHLGGRHGREPAPRCPYPDPRRRNTPHASC